MDITFQPGGIRYARTMEKSSTINDLAIVAAPLVVGGTMRGGPNGARRDERCAVGGAWTDGPDAPEQRGGCDGRRRTRPRRVVSISRRRDPRVEHRHQQVAARIDLAFGPLADPTGAAPAAARVRDVVHPLPGGVEHGA